MYYKIEPWLNVAKKVKFKKHYQCPNFKIENKKAVQLFSLQCLNSYHEKYMIKFSSLKKMIFKIKYIIYDTTLHNMTSSRYIKVTLHTKNEVGGH